MPPPCRSPGTGGGRVTSPPHRPAHRERWFRRNSGNPGSAGCDESRTSGAEGGPGKRTQSNLGAAPRSDPYIIGARNASAIGTLVERTTRYLLLVHLPNGYTAEAARDGLIATIRTLPRELRRSLTWDQGGELARHAEIRYATDMDIYFCDPHSPWQRGTNENTNGLLRQYFAKGTDLKLHDAAELQRVAAELNSRPRKTLDWATPAARLNHLLSTTTATG
jgi:IS30 family transposase